MIAGHKKLSRISQPAAPVRLDLSIIGGDAKNPTIHEETPANHRGFRVKGQHGESPGGNDHASAGDGREPDSNNSRLKFSPNSQQYYSSGGVEKQDSCYFSDSENCHSDASRSVSTTSDGIELAVPPSAKPALATSFSAASSRETGRSIDRSIDRPSSSAGLTRPSVKFRDCDSGVGLDGRDSDKIPTSDSIKFDEMVLDFSSKLSCTTDEDALGGPNGDHTWAARVKSSLKHKGSNDSGADSGWPSPPQQENQPGAEDPLRKSLSVLVSMAAADTNSGVHLHNASLTSLNNESQEGNFNQVLDNHLPPFIYNQNARTLPDQNDIMTSSSMTSSWHQYQHDNHSLLTDQALQSTPEYASMLDFTLRLGYTEAKLLYVLRKCCAIYLSTDKLLQELMKLGQDLDAGHDGSSDEDSAKPVVRDEDSPPLARASARKRPIIIDGSNLAMSYGHKKVFACLGVKKAIEYFQARGHTEVLVFVPQYRKEDSRSSSPITDKHILDDLASDGTLVWTPSRRLGGRRIICHDDRYILKTAVEKEAVVVSNDEFRDMAKESAEFRKVVEERLLMYSFVNGEFVPPDDPLGRWGPSLDQFLSFDTAPPPGPRNTLRCPYGRKCTYGVKCKYSHPERKGNVQTVAERLLQHAEQERKRGSYTKLNMLDSTGSMERMLIHPGGYDRARKPAERTRSFNPALLRRPNGPSGGSGYGHHQTHVPQATDIGGYPFQDRQYAAFAHGHNLMLPPGAIDQHDSPLLQQTLSFPNLQLSDLPPPDLRGGSMSARDHVDHRGDDPGLLANRDLVRVQSAAGFMFGTPEMHANLCKQNSDPLNPSRSGGSAPKTSPKRAGAHPPSPLSYSGRGSANATGSDGETTSGNQAPVNQKDWLSVPRNPPGNAGLGMVTDKIVPQHAVVSRYASAPGNSSFGRPIATDPAVSPPRRSGSAVPVNPALSKQELKSTPSFPPIPPAKGNIWGNLENSVQSPIFINYPSEGSVEFVAPPPGLEPLDYEGPPTVFKPSIEQVLDNMRRIFGDSVVNRVLFDNPGLQDVQKLCRLVVEAAPDADKLT